MAEDVKMDWNDFVAQKSAEYDLDPGAWRPLTETAIVSFDYDDKGYISGKHKGRMVYRDSGSERKILAGEIWICTLSINPKTGVNYFAKAVQRIDGSFFLELKRDQITEIAEILWERHRTELEPAMKERYEDRTQRRIALAVLNAKDDFEEERELLRSEIDGYKKSLEEAETREDGLRAELDEAVSKTEALRKSIDEKDALIEKLKALPPKASSKGKKAPCTVFDDDDYLETHEPGRKTKEIRRTGPDTLESSAFKNRVCTVRANMDGTLLRIRFDDIHGNVTCRDGKMVLHSLDTISPWDGKSEPLSCRLDADGGMVVHLRD